MFLKKEIKKIELDAFMCQVLQEAIEKNNRQEQIITCLREIHTDMLIIDAYPDDLVNANHQLLAAYDNHGMRERADNHYDELSGLIFASMINIAQFLTQRLNLTGKDSPLVLRDGADPRFGDNFYYAPQYYRVALSSKLIPQLKNLVDEPCSHEENTTTLEY